MHANTAFEIFRPVILLAAIAFMVGFVSYLALGGGATALAESHQRSHAEMVSGPASQDWNLPKHI